MATRPSSIRFRSPISTTTCGSFGAGRKPRGHRLWSSRTAGRSANITSTSISRPGPSRSSPKWTPQGLLDARARRPAIIPDDEGNMRQRRAGSQAGQRPWHSGVDRRPRPTRGSWCALGNVGLRSGRDEQHGGAADGDDQSGASPRPRPRSGLDRAGQARRPGGPRQEPARRISTTRPAFISR